MCTKTSFEPSVGWMKPNPFWTLKNLTTPCGMLASGLRAKRMFRHADRRSKTAIRVFRSVLKKATLRIARARQAKKLEHYRLKRASNAGQGNAARELERAGVIDRGRRQVTILDRPGLMEASCECYQLVRTHIAHHLPKTFG